MIALDTNILARFYVDDPHDPEAARQRPISAVVASNKGYSGFGWFILGFLFGRLGPILALVVGKNEAAVEQSAIQSSNMKKRPYCAEIIKTEDIKCRFCGAAA
jgi:hypothetical protein